MRRPILPALPLVVTELGAGPPLLFLHGLLGRARNWLTVGRALADRFAVRLADLRNHGASPWSEEAGYAAMAADVATLIEGAAAGPVTLVGHSMGGKVAMALALTRPDLVGRLIVVDIAPVRYASGYERFVRAMLAADLSPGRRRADVDAELAASVPDAADARLPDAEPGQPRRAVSLAAQSRRTPAGDAGADGISRASG